MKPSAADSAWVGLLAIARSRRPVLAAGVVVFSFLAIAPQGDSLTVLHSHQWPGYDNLSAGVIADDDGNLYGTTPSSGRALRGTVFRMRKDGSGLALLHSFTDPYDANPRAALVMDGSGNLFGTTYSDPFGEYGSYGAGSVFTLKTDGTGFKTLHVFTGIGSDVGSQWPLVLDGFGNLFGTTRGGPYDYGTVFRLRTDGTEFTILHSFGRVPHDGLGPGKLVLSTSGWLYGTTASGGSSGAGTAFAVKTDGRAFHVIHTFLGGSSDGAEPTATLVPRHSNDLYGTTIAGGSGSKGVVFSLQTDGTAFTLLHSFTGGVSDGESPAGLALGGLGNLFGTTGNGGSLIGGAGLGTLYALRTDGTDFNLLHSFQGETIDGEFPGDILVDDSGDIYGITNGGASFTRGAVFKVRTEGTQFAQLLVLSTREGAEPTASLHLDGSGSLYGTTRGGGYGAGTVFSLDIATTNFRLLHSFGGGPDYGLYPNGAVIMDGSGYLYGVTETDGFYSYGTIFRQRKDGSSHSLLYRFMDGYDGVYPVGPLALDSLGRLYGSTLTSVFSLGSDGTGFTPLHTFSGGASDGGSCEAPVISDGVGNLYGTTFSGGTGAVYGLGTVYSLRTDGSGFRILHSFAGPPADGAEPRSGLVLDTSGNLYGTTSTGGLSDLGTVFRVKTDGSGYAVLHSFAGGIEDGDWPLASLALDAMGNLYGTTVRGGPLGLGTVFALRNDGSGYRLVHSFAGTPSDGAYPFAGVVLDGKGSLIGTTIFGGAWDQGVEFKLVANPGDANGGGGRRLHPPRRRTRCVRC